MCHSAFIKNRAGKGITKIKAIIFLHVSLKCHIGDISKSLFSFMILLDLIFNKAKLAIKESALV